jgi:hypothetical protein
MASDRTDQDLAKARMGMGARIAQFALRHLEHIDPRTATFLKDAHLLKEGGMIGDGDEIRALVLDSDVLDAPMGPYIFVRGEGVAAIDMTRLLFDHDGDVRRRAVKHVSALAASRLLCGSTAREFQAHQGRIASDKEGWRASALAFYDSLNDDVLLSRAGLMQSIATRYDEGYSEHLPRVLRPSANALHKFSPHPRAGDQQKECERQILEWTRLRKIEDALDEYLLRWGHVPLCAPLSMGSLVKGWLQAHESEGPLWELLWEWRDTQKTPLAQYHVCEVLSAFPEAVPQDKTGTLWKELARVANDYVGSEDTPEAQAWVIRRELARHYCRYIPSVVPGVDGELCGVASWQLAELVSSLFGEDGHAIRQFRESALPQELTFSGVAHEIIHPRVSPSNLRYETLFAFSVWSRALQSHLASFLAVLPGPNHEEQRRVTPSLTRSLLVSLPDGAPEMQARYSFELPLAETIRSWMPSLEEDSTEGQTLNACLEAIEGFADEGEFASTVDELGRGTDGSDALVCSYIRRQAYARRASADKLWECLSDREWRGKALHQLDVYSLAVLLDGLVEVQSAGVGNWRARLPYFFALSTEAVMEDETKRSMFFAMTVCASIAGGTVSAIRWLLSGKHASVLAGDAMNWHEQLSAIAEGSSGWSAGAVRAVLIDLGPQTTASSGD